MYPGRFHIGFSEGLGGGFSRRNRSGASIVPPGQAVRELTVPRRWQTAAVVLVAGAGLLVAVVVNPVVAGAALVTGMLNTAGGGGAVVTFLALSATGVPALTAHATSQLVTPASFLGGLRTAREYRPDRRWMVAGTAGAICGVGILAVTPANTFQALAPWCLLPSAALVVIQEPVRRLVRSTGRWIGPTTTTVAVFVCGVYAGLIGVGTGTLAVAVLGLVPAFVSTPIATLLRTRNVLLTVMAVVVSATFAVTGLADWALVAQLAVPAAVGGWLGTQLIGHVPAWTLRAVIVATAVAATVWLITRP
jgi:uncharacterized membrane protein YfcA